MKDLGRTAPTTGLDPRRFAHGSRVPGWDDPVDISKDPATLPDPATTPVPAELRAAIESHMAKYPDHRSAAIPALAAAQRLHGWCSPEAIEQVACVMRLTPAYLIAVASFYDMLDTEPVGHRRVYVCTNISCSLNGGRELLERLQSELGDADDVQVRGFECLGACDIAPMASIDGVYVGPIADGDVAELARQVREGADPLPGKQLLGRRSVDPGAGAPDLAPAAFGEPMGTPEPEGPPAPIEQPATPPPSEEDPA